MDTQALAQYQVTQAPVVIQDSQQTRDIPVCLGIQDSVATLASQDTVGSVVHLVTLAFPATQVCQGLQGIQGSVATVV